MIRVLMSVFHAGMGWVEQINDTVSKFMHRLFLLAEVLVIIKIRAQINEINGFKMVKHDQLQVYNIADIKLRL